MKLLILGKNGQVGWELQRALAPLGEVTALGHAEADLEDAAGLRGALTAAQPDIIVNAAAYTAVDKAESESERADRINHRAVSEIGQFAAAAGAWVIHYSTDYVFDGSKTGAYVETDPPAPLSVYGQSKLAGELALGQSGARHLIFRTSWVHSAHGANFVRTILRLARERDSLRVVADQHGAPTSAEFIADVTAQAVAAIARDAAPTPGVYHLAASGETSWHGLASFAIAEAIAAGLKLRATPERVQPITSGEYPTAARRPANSRLDTGKIRSEFAAILPDWKYCVTRTVIELCRQDLR